MKYLLWFAFLAAVWWLWSKRRAGGGEDASERHDPAAEKMVTCAHCGVYLPESEGVMEGERVYCCEAHRSAASSMEG